MYLLELLPAMTCIRFSEAGKTKHFSKFFGSVRTRCLGLSADYEKKLSRIALILLVGPAGPYKD
jgi:hypothetical protein